MIQFFDTNFFSPYQGCANEATKFSSTRRVVYKITKIGLKRFLIHYLTCGLLSVFPWRKSASSHTSIQNLVKSSVLSILICCTFLTDISSQSRILIKNLNCSLSHLKYAYHLYLWCKLWSQWFDIIQKQI